MLKNVIKKSAILLCSIIVLLMVSATSAKAATKIDAPANPKWGDGMIEMNFKPSQNGTGNYKVNVYKEGSSDVLFKTSWHISPNNYKSDGTASIWLSDRVNWGSGEYYFTVQSVANGDDSLEDSEIVRSSSITYTAPESRLDTPTDIKVDGYKVTATLPEGAGFMVLLKKTDKSWNHWQFDRKYPGRIITLDMSNWIEEEGDYQVKVAALSRDITKIRDSHFSDYYDVKPTGSSSGKINDLISDEVINNPDQSKAVLAQNKEDVIVALNTDSEATQKIERAEEEYKKQKNVTVNPPKVEGSAASKFEGTPKIIGAAFNTPNNQSVTLKLDSPKAELDYDKNMYNNAVQVSIKLERSDGKSISELSVPVKIILPIPKGVQKQNLVILHKHENGNVERIVPKVEGDSISFVVTSFSEFLFANEKSSSDDEGDDNSETEYVDRNTYKSELPAKTVISQVKADPFSIMDMKVHALDAATTVNQEFLADYFAKTLGGKGANVITSYGVYATRDLAITEKSQKRTLTWNNLSVKTPGSIYAICYDKDNGAYLITGTVSDKGMAQFADYRLAEASSITVFTLK